MRVAIVGGRLQGVEAAYLALKAGWQSLLIDRDPDVPARGLAHTFVQSDVTTESSAISDLLKDTDLIIPALENHGALKSLKDLAERKHYPLAYDDAAYAITSSKKKSDSLFKELGLPAPRPWPECGFPVILKPSESSGSQGIHRMGNFEELDAFVQKTNLQNRDCIIQEFLEGPSYSLEVIGINGNYHPLQPTIIDVDTEFDCKRVIAPTGLSEVLEKQFDEIAVTAAEAVNLKGIMDIEVILHKNELKILEIDARLPSQTPTAVFKSTGINMLELLYDIFNSGKIPTIPKIGNEKAVIYEHVRVRPDTLVVSGEHVISEARPLCYRRNFFGADEALTDFGSDNRNWVATLILSAKTKEDVIHKHYRVLDTIRSTFRLRECPDSYPELV
ncbi:MAG: 3-methylornithine--L-lysine ligase PylC [Candidatus Aminicenantes bacterium]